MNKAKKINLIFTLLLVICTAFFICSCKDGDNAVQTLPPISNEGYEVVTEIDPPILNIISAEDFSLDQAPDAVINKVYKLYDAKAFDCFGVELDVEVKVWRFYYSETASLVEFDGEFVPTSYGKYTVEYSAVDKMGNKTVEIYNFECKQKEELRATLASGTEVVAECYVGEEIQVADIDFEYNVGEVDCKIYAVSKSSGVVTEISNDLVIPVYSGEYEIKYVFNDYNESGSISYTIDVKEYSKPRIYGDAVLYKYYILGCEYSLPELNCVSYLNGEPAKIQPEVYVIYDGKLPEKIDPNSFVPQNEGEFRIKYVASVNEQTEERIYTASCVDTGFNDVIKIKKYFASDASFKANSLKSGVQLTTSEKECKVYFINPLLSRKLETSFAFDANNNFSNFNFYLEDSLDKSIKIKIGLIKTSSGEVLFSVNDSQSLNKTDISFFSDLTSTFSYDESALAVSFNNGYAMTVRKDYSGNSFKGFPSGNVYLSCEFSGVSSKSSVVIKSIDNQSLSEGCRYSAPYVVYKQYKEGKKNVGDSIELSRLYVGGVLLPNFEVSYSIEGPDGKAPMDVNGIVMNEENMAYWEDHVFKPQLIGLYSVDIIAKNVKNTNPLPLSYSIEVIDSEAPVIKLEGELEKEYKLGSKFKALKATVTDNFSQANSLCIYVYAPNGVLYQYLDNVEFVLNQVGKYTVYYQALDEAENVSSVSYTFEVVK